jgi:hypothetical protein
VLFVHEIHSVPGRTGDAFEALLRERWAPALAREDGSRLVWCVRSMPGSVSYPELITLTAVADGEALERLGARMRTGDLRADVAALDAGRAQVTRRIVAQLVFSPLNIDLDAIPAVPEPVDGPSAMYIHDFVLPRLGMQREYEIAMREVFMKMLETEGTGIGMWGGFETVAGGGPAPESLMVSHIGNPETGTRLLSSEVPRAAVKPGAWILDGLKLRDTWVSRLVRTVSWSPIR